MNAAVSLNSFQFENAHLLVTHQGLSVDESSSHRSKLSSETISQTARVQVIIRENVNLKTKKGKVNLVLPGNKDRIVRNIH